MKKLYNSQFIRYSLFGGIATIVDWGLFYLFNYWLGIHYAFSVSVSYFCGTITNFTLNKYYNFKNNYKNIIKQYSLFLVIALIGLLITLGLMSFFIEILKLSAIISRIIATAIVLIYNYFGQKNITFKILK